MIFTVTLKALYLIPRMQIILVETSRDVNFDRLSFSTDGQPKAGPDDVTDH